jgi:hypothetical protein
MIEPGHVAMWNRAKNRREFFQRIQFLTFIEYEKYDLDIAPDTATGMFDYPSLPRLLEYVRKNREFHIVSCLDQDACINTCIPGANIFLMAEGDSDPSLLWDPDTIVDEAYLQSLNSKFRRRFPKSILAA